MLTENSLRPNLCCHLPSFTQKQCSSAFLHQQLRYSILRFPQISRPGNVVVTATSSSSTKNLSVKKRRTRAGKPVKSNSELCNDLNEFVSVVGLPEGHVPSWKELTEHGRKDLANLARRRGYKLITELLTDSHEESTITSAENQDANGDFENVIVDEKESAPSDNFDWSSTVLSEKESALSDDNFNWGSAVLAEKEFALSDDNLRWSSADLAEKESAPSDNMFSRSSADCAEEVSAPSDDNFSWDNLSVDNAGQPPIADITQSSVESATSSSLQLQDRAAKFVLDGVLDVIEGEVDEGERFTELVAESPYSEESSKCEAAESNSIPTCTEVSELVAPLATEYSGGRHDLLSAEELNSSQYNEAGERNNQVEIDHLKVMLYQKELELTQLKERIEKEKIALSNLQAKAEMEIEKSQEIIMAKHEELHAAEESLSGLKEVEIEFWGNHDTVKVAGSFNGWHQPIYMDRVPSTSINPTATGLRNLNLWSTKLWLYPGVYEIKFIVDGHWTIDPRRETSRGTIQNNILRVEI